MGLFSLVNHQLKCYHHMVLDSFVLLVLNRPVRIVNLSFARNQLISAMKRIFGYSLLLFIVAIDLFFSFQGSD